MQRFALRLLGLITVAGSLAASGCQLSSATQNVQGVRDFQSGRYDAAAQRFQLASLENPNNPDTLYNLGATLHQMAYLKEQQARTQDEQDEIRDLQIQAEEVYNRCLDLNEDHVECRRSLAVLLTEMGRSEQAFTLLQRWATANPELADARIELARLYEEHGDTDTALLHLHQAMRVGDINSRAHSRAWAAAGLIRERRGELAQAQQNFQQAYSLNRDQPGVGYHLAGLTRRVRSDSFQSQSAGTRLVRDEDPTSRSGGRY